MTQELDVCLCWNWLGQEKIVWYNSFTSFYPVFDFSHGFWLKASLSTINNNRFRWREIETLSQISPWRMDIQGILNTVAISIFNAIVFIGLCMWGIIYKCKGVVNVKMNIDEAISLGICIDSWVYRTYLFFSKWF